MNKLTPKHIVISLVETMCHTVSILPLTTLLKKHFPQCTIHVILQEHLATIVNNCPQIDGAIAWSELKTQSEQGIIQRFQAFDTILHVSSNPKIARLAKKAKIANRIGARHPWYHYLHCNIQIPLNREREQLHESQLMLKLLAPFAIPSDYSVKEMVELIQINHAITLSNNLADHFDENKFNLVLQPEVNENWAVSLFSNLITQLNHKQYNILIVGPKKLSENLGDLGDNYPHATNLCGKVNLNDFLSLCQKADGFITNTSGPAHIAAALGTRTLELIPHPLKPMRIHSLGREAQHLVCSNPIEDTVEKTVIITNDWLKPKAHPIAKLRQPLLV